MVSSSAGKRKAIVPLVASQRRDNTDMLLRHLNGDGSIYFFPLLKLLSLSNDVIHSVPKSQLPVGHWRVFLHLCLVVQSLYKSKGAPLDVAAMTPIRTSRAEISAASQQNYTWEEAQGLMHALVGHQVRVDYGADETEGRREGSVSFSLFSFADVRKDKDEITFLLSPVLTALITSTEARFTQLDLALLRLTRSTMALRLALVASGINKPTCRVSALLSIERWQQVLGDEDMDSRTFLQAVRRGIEQVNSVALDFELSMQEERSPNRRGRGTITGFRFATQTAQQARLPLEGGESDRDLLRRLLALDDSPLQHRGATQTWAKNTLEALDLGKYRRPWFLEKLASVERSLTARSKLRVFKKILADGAAPAAQRVAVRSTVSALGVVSSLGEAEQWFSSLSKADQGDISADFRRHMMKQSEVLTAVPVEKARELEAAMWVPFLSQRFKQRRGSYSESGATAFGLRSSTGSVR